MIPVPSGARVWLATGVTDMWRGMNTLALQVQQGLGRDPDKLKARFAPDRGSMPSVRIAKPLLAGYGGLLDAGGAA